MGKWSNRKTVSNTVSVSIRQNIATNYKLSDLNTIGAKNWLTQKDLSLDKFTDFYSFLLVSKRSKKYIIDRLKENGIEITFDPLYPNDKDTYEAHMYLFSKKDHPIWEDFVQTDIGPIDNLIEDYLKLGKEINKVPSTNRKLKRSK
jgi:hypothetical protein